MTERVVITASSAITPIGNELDIISSNLRKGYSGITCIKRYDMDRFDVRHAGEIDIKILDEIEYPIEGNIQFEFFYYCLSRLCTGLVHNYKKERIGCILGTDPNTGTAQDFGNLMLDYTNSRKHDFKVNSRNTVNINPSLLLFHAAKDFGIWGPSFCNLGTCAASTQAIGTGYRLLKQNATDLMIVGGVSAKIDPISISRLSRLGALEKTEENISDNCRPFDRRRSGFTMSEGCILLLLERESDARRRNANILAEVKGYGAALDGYSMTDPHVDALGMQLAMERAIEDAGIRLEEIDYINAHGTGTKKNDLYETRAIKNIFKEDAYKLNISSTKSMHGHLMTASGAMEVLSCILAIRDSFIPPTIHYKDPDPECDLFYVPNDSIEKSINYALSNSFGLGGQNASILIAKYER